MRCEIGWPTVTFVPGSSDTFSRISSSTSSLGRSFIVEPHVDLRGLDALHVLVQLGPAGPPGRRRHLRHAQQHPLQRIAERVRVRQTGPGKVTALTVSAPSLNSGRNERPATAMPTTAATSSDRGRRDRPVRQ